MRSGSTGEDPLDAEVVLPVIVEVILVAEALPHPELEHVPAHPVGVVHKAHASAVAHAIVLAVNMEAVQMGIGPPQGELERVVEIRDCAVAAPQPAPDQGADPPQHHAELIRDRHGRGRRRVRAAGCSR